MKNGTSTSSTQQCHQEKLAVDYMLGFPHREVFRCLLGERDEKSAKKRGPDQLVGSRAVIGAAAAAAERFLCTRTRVLSASCNDCKDGLLIVSSSPPDRSFQKAQAQAPTSRGCERFFFGAFMASSMSCRARSTR